MIAAVTDLVRQWQALKQSAEAMCSGKGLLGKGYWSGVMCAAESVRHHLP